MSKSDEHENIVSSERRRLVEELHVSVRKNFPRRHVIVRGYVDLWQADIVEMLLYSRFNRGHHYILTVIDMLSKYAWAVPLKSKAGNETAEVIARIIRESERCPKNLQTDIGKEFYNADVQRLVKKHGINHYSTYSVLKASVIERFNRTLKNNMWKMFTRELQVDRRAAASRVRLTRASIERSACTRRRHVRGRRKTLDYSV